MWNSHTLIVCENHLVEEATLKRRKNKWVVVLFLDTCLSSASDMLKWELLVFSFAAHQCSESEKVSIIINFVY